MNVKKIVYTYVLAFLACSVLFAQQDVNFERLSIDDGLSQGNVNAIIQDAQGFMWFATQDGLNRFNGYEFTVFKPDNTNEYSLTNNVIKSIYESKDSCIWVGTDGGGLNMYNPKTNKFIAYQHNPDDPLTLSNNSIYAIYEDSDGKIWVGTFGGGVSVLDRSTGNFTTYQNDPADHYSLTGNAIRAIFNDSEGNIWVGVDGGGLNKYDKVRKRFTSYRHDPNNPESLGSDIVLCVHIDSDGYFWVGSWAGGVSKFDPKTGKTVVYKNDPLIQGSLSSNENFGILEDSNGDMWICTRKGLDLLNDDGKTFTHFKNDPLVETSLSFDIVISLFEDNAGVLWVGTEGGGLCKYDLKKKKFLHYNNDYKNPNSISHNEVTCIYEDTKGIYWFSTRAGGVNYTELGSGIFKKIRFDPTTSNSLISDNIQIILEDGRGQYWFGSNGAGISRYNQETGAFTQFRENPANPKALSNNAIFGLVEDREGYIWISTYGGGINRYDYKTNTFKRYTIDANNQMKDVGLCLYMDSEGTIWCGSSGHGLLEYNKEADKFMYHENNADDPFSISNNVIFSIYEDKELNLWIGTGGAGLDKYVRSEEKFYNFNSKDGLVSDVIAGILSDDNGNLWITTVKGLSRFSLKDSVFRNYDVLDGLQSNIFINNSTYKNANGYLFFGGVNGFNYFHPDSIFDNEVVPKIVITDFKLFNESVLPGDEFGVLKHTISNTDEIVLSYDLNKFSFEFSALHFTSPSKNQYKYMMEGFDKDWVSTNHERRFASYTNLPGGTYTFRVIASNNDGIWNNEGAALTVIIVPPYWQSWWFYTIIAIIVGALIYLIFRYREQQAKVEKEKLQSKIDSAISEVEKQKKDILKQNDELQQRQLEDQQRQWFNEGIATFTDLIRQNKDNIEQLSMSILSNMIRYIKAVQGGMYIINEDDVNDKYLQLIASYAYEGDKRKMERIEIGESLVGSVYKEKVVRKINNIPNDYLKFNSGLGESKPNCLILIPLKLDELIFGVLEIASINEITDFEIQFIEKLGEVVTSQLFTTRITEKTQLLLIQSQKQAEELRAQEEEARQNIEEMQANREEAMRLKSDALGYLNSMNHSTIRADFDLDGKLTYGNVRFLDCFGYTSKESNGMHVTEFFKDEERADFQERWNELLNGSKHIEEQYDHLTKDGSILLLSTYTIVKNIEGIPQKVLYLGLDLNDQMLLRENDCNPEETIDKILVRVELDKNGAILRANDYFVDLMDLDDKDDVKDLNIDVFLSSKERSKFKRNWDKVLEGESHEGEYSRRNKLGELRWFKISLTPQMQGNEVVKVFYFAFDITDKMNELLETERKLKETEKVFKAQLLNAEKRIKELEQENGK